MITKSDYDEWLNHPVTEAFKEACAVRIQDAKDELATRAGLDPDADNFTRGFIHAYNEIKEFYVEDAE